MSAHEIIQAIRECLTRCPNYINVEPNRCLTCPARDKCGRGSPIDMEDTRASSLCPEDPQHCMSLTNQGYCRKEWIPTKCPCVLDIKQIQPLQCRVCGCTRYTYSSVSKLVIRQYSPGCPLCGATMWDINELRKYMLGEGEYRPGGEYWTSNFGPRKEIKEA